MPGFCGSGTPSNARSPIPQPEKFLCRTDRVGTLQGQGCFLAALMNSYRLRLRRGRRSLACHLRRYPNRNYGRGYGRGHQHHSTG